MISLFFIGSGVSIVTLKQAGSKVLLQAVVLWIMVSVAALLFVMYM